MKYVLQGVISDWCQAGDDNGVGISGVPVAMWADNNLFGKEVTVRWWMADKELSEEERLNTVVYMAIGRPITEWYGSYSELTGHLWTNSAFKVGGHDMEKILRDNINKWCYLEVVVEKQ